MRLIDIFRMALGNLRRNKMRTVLTVTGVVVGIGSIVFLVSLGFGLQELMINKVANLDALTVISVRPGTKEGTSITKETIEKFKAFSEVVEVSPIVSYPAQIKTDNLESETVVYGVSPKMFGLEDIKVDYGSKELNEGENGAIVSVASLKSLDLASPEKLIGTELNYKLIRLDESGNAKAMDGAGDLKLKITGIAAEDKIKFTYVPLAVLGELQNTNFTAAKVRVAERKQIANVRKAIESMGFPTSSIKDTVDQIDRAFVIVKSVLGGFGMIALFVAAIGIFNTMTISLLERTHEIGIMKAIGGRNRDVALVFTAEAAMIGLLGGLFGVFCGWLLGASIGGLINFIATSVGGEANDYFATPVDFVIIVVTFSFVVSTVAGIWPAKRAARLNPLEALRYE